MLCKIDGLMKIALLSIVMVLFSFRPPALQQASKVVEELDKLGYFKFSDQGNIAKLKSELMENFSRHKILSTVIDDETLLPYDHRLYFCDGESLFEAGGLEEYLRYAQHAFEKRVLKLKWANEISSQKGNVLSHRITVNGKEYVAFEGNMNRSDIWGIAQRNFYQLLNDQLEIQGSSERVYPISAGEEGQFVFLTEELFDYITKTFYQGEGFKRHEIILPMERWEIMMGFR